MNREPGGALDGSIIMDEVPQLSLEAVRDWLGEGEIRKGRPYFQRRALSRLQRTGGHLKAFCQGSAAQPYRVQLWLGADGIETGVCSCPVGGGGTCKHSAALLLAWLDDPTAFREVEALEDALERREKAELIALIRRMVEQYPDLEDLLALPMPAGNTAPTAAVSAEAIRDQARQAFWGLGDEWGAAGAAAAALSRLVGLGDGYAASGDWRGAATVYGIVGQEAMGHFEAVDDSDGELGAVISQCAEGLRRCLEGVTEPIQREGILRACVDLYIVAHPYGLADETPAWMADAASPEERRRVAGWIRARLADPQSDMSPYDRQELGGFLLDLIGPEIDDAAYLAICRETGRRADLIERLLVLGRRDEAAQIVRETGDDGFLRLVDLLRVHDPERAEELVRERVAVIGPDRQRAYARQSLLSWLKGRARERGDLAGALDLAEGLFWPQPSLQGYDELKELHDGLGRWAAARPALLERLRQARQYPLLTEIHLREGELEPALEMVLLVPGATTYGHGYVLYSAEPLTIRVARAAEASHPREAIGLYMGVIESLIAAQGRANYTTAAGYLARVRDLYRRIEDEAGWTRLIAELRDQHRRLRALKEELEKAGL
jgi:uncharacterized Zn finger protein